MTDTAPDQLRDAATIVLLRHDMAQGPSVLMGQRGANAAFMPSKYVFPGGAIDPADSHVTFASSLGPQTAHRLTCDAAPGLGSALAAAAIRETWEETGLAIATAAPPKNHGWASFTRDGLAPCAGALTFIFRAITPYGRPRRFDARFFLVDSTSVHGDLDDFSRAGSELSHIHWVPLARTRQLDLPFVTEIVLAEVAHHLASPHTADHGTPFFDNRTARGIVTRLI
ncbi:hypothetical protein BFP70_11025 [Thioclava sp. SK-1]|uniref:NUDIX hydrolase n=1 Tax=Thioclava sp. SK-1 TaxID=1889770 RepID=UPI000827105E|nr:NUDIX domain-containing protein [Thioclava sp. SK-1]OCX64560.1 hypothetical protein BFP70_11025 [Thioclava sp. SK-1]